MFWLYCVAVLPFCHFLYALFPYVSISELMLDAAYPLRQLNTKKTLYCPIFHISIPTPVAGMFHNFLLVGPFEYFLMAVFIFVCDEHFFEFLCLVFFLLLFSQSFEVAYDSSLPLFLLTTCWSNFLFPSLQSVVFFEKKGPSQNPLPQNKTSSNKNSKERTSNREMYISPAQQVYPTLLASNKWHCRMTNQWLTIWILCPLPVWSALFTLIHKCEKKNNTDLDYIFSRNNQRIPWSFQLSSPFSVFLPIPSPLPVPFSLDFILSSDSNYTTWPLPAL